MAENHYVDPKDQHIAAEGVPSRSDLTTAYRDAAHETLGPWMKEDERQAAMEKDRQKIIRGLRKSAFLIGASISIPVVISVAIVKFMTTQVNTENEIYLVFALVLAFGIFLGITYSMFKWVGQTFRNHNLRAMPITVTTLLCLFFLIMPALRYFSVKPSGLEIYVYSLGSLLVAGILIATISIFVWTTRWIPGLLKILILLAFFGASVAVAYLA